MLCAAPLQDLFGRRRRAVRAKGLPRTADVGGKSLRNRLLNLPSNVESLLLGLLYILYPIIASKNTCKKEGRLEMLGEIMEIDRQIHRKLGYKAGEQTTNRKYDMKVAIEYCSSRSVLVRPSLPNLEGPPKFPL